MLTAHLAHAIAAQTYRDTKAMARAKSISLRLINFNLGYLNPTDYLIQKGL
jgi:hypothetical protein